MANLSVPLIKLFLFTSNPAINICEHLWLFPKETFLEIDLLRQWLCKILRLLIQIAKLSSTIVWIYTPTSRKSKYLFSYSLANMRYYYIKIYFANWRAKNHSVSFSFSFLWFPEKVNFFMFIGHLFWGIICSSFVIFFSVWASIFFLMQFEGLFLCWGYVFFYHMICIFPVCLLHFYMFFCFLLLFWNTLRLIEKLQVQYKDLFFPRPFGG